MGLVSGGESIMNLSIQARSILLICSVLTVVTAAMTGWNIYQQRQLFDNEIESRLDQLTRLQASSLVESVWNLNTDSATQNLESLLRDRDFFSAEILMPNGSWFASAKRPGDQGVRTVTRTADISIHYENNPRIIGTLNLTMSTARLEEEQAQALKKFVALAFFQLVAVLFATSLAIHLIEKPLDRIACSMLSLSEGHTDIEIETGTRPDQITQLSNAVVKFRDSLVENDRLHQELVKKERLAILGQLSATVGHELRNPLGVISNSLVLIRSHQCDENQKTEKYLEKIQKSVDRCKNIIRELLDYARDSIVNLKPFAIDAWLSDVFDDQMLPDGIKIGFDLRSNERILIDDERMRRAVINVFENACQAMQGSTDARQDNTLTVSCRNSVDKIELIISDSGPGIPEESMDKIFEPFYSTKNFGAGLGLSIVKKIMEEHEGGVEVKPNVGPGISVVLWLPLKTENLRNNGCHL